MNNRLLTNLTLIASCALLITSCGGDGYSDPAITGSSNNDVQTQIPDQNSFSLSVEKTAVDALDFEGVTSNVTIRVADRHNNPVPDNTAVKFLTNGGRVEPQCLTVNGDCSVLWTEQAPTPAPSFKAIIIAYTAGEESFIDLNDNDRYDFGETFTDTSEPFFDVNENAINDAEEFVDADGDNEFDVADGKFTGQPCIGDVTVCNRVSTLVWDTAEILLSGSNAYITIASGALPTAVNSTSFLTLNIVDVNGNAMPDGTTVGLTSAKGEADPTAWDFAPRGTDILVAYTTGPDDGISETLKVEVITPLGRKSVQLFSTSALTP